MRILHFDLDTLRPDHLGCYGYQRATSPNIDRLSAQGVRFEQFYSSDPPCLPSRTATMTGRFGFHTGVVGHGGTESAEEVTPAGEPLPVWLTPEVLADHRQLSGPHSAQQINMFDNRSDPRYPRYPGELCDMADVRCLIDGYDCGMAYMDEHIGQVLEALQARGVLDELVIIISSDHGENLGEL